MALTETAGQTTTTGTTEINIFDVTTAGPKYFTTSIFMDALTASETMEVYVYLYDVQDATYRLAWGPLDGLIFTGIQDSPAKYMPTVLSKQHKIGLKMTVGTNRAISWVRYEHT